jgi:hypothetical protein
MHYSSQNLTDGRLPLFVHGRAWLRRSYESRHVIHWEWSLGKLARDFAATISFGNRDDGLLFHFCVPFLFSIFIGIDGIFRCKACKLGVGISNQAVWFYPLSWEMESATKEDPWYRSHYSFGFPWEYSWFSTEILSHDKNDGKQIVIWKETKKNRRKAFEGFEDRKKAAHSVSKDYPYSYILKNREIQNRTATVHVTRMTWRRKFIPFLKKVFTSIDVRFDKEVGEETGSWKGGCMGCNYEMKWMETPERCLSRMEHEREFRR